MGLPYATRKDSAFIVAKLINILPAKATAKLTGIAVTTVGRTGNESALNEIVIP
jgi:hypothetical protein